MKASNRKNVNSMAVVGARCPLLEHLQPLAMMLPGASTQQPQTPTTSSQTPALKVEVLCCAGEQHLLNQHNSM
jgi:hypothetical protein